MLNLSVLSHRRLHFSPNFADDIAASSVRSFSHIGPCCNDYRSLEECGFVLQSVPTPSLPLSLPHSVSPPLCLTGLFPNFSLFLTRPSRNIPLWGHISCHRFRPWAPRRERHFQLLARYCAPLLTRVLTAAQSSHQWL